MPEPDDELRRGLRSLAHRAASASSGPDPAEVRSRGARRRRRRVTALAAVVTLAVVGVGTVAFGAASQDAGSGPVAPATGDTGSDLSADDLPTADELPGFNEITGWRVVSTTPGDGQSAVSLCQQQTMVGLGATGVWRRDFTMTSDLPPGTRPDPDAVPGSTSIVAAEFAADEEARLAAATVRSWVEECDPASYDKTDVNEIGGIAADDTEGTAWLLVHTPVEGQPDFGLFDGTAVGVSGSRVVLISQTLVGMDYNYTGRTPIEGALAAALDRLPPG